jgi:hypothetical protein
MTHLSMRSMDILPVEGQVSSPVFRWPIWACVIWTFYLLRSDQPSVEMTHLSMRSMNILPVEGQVASRVLRWPHQSQSRPLSGTQNQTHQPEENSFYRCFVAMSYIILIQRRCGSDSSGYELWCSAQTVQFRTFPKHIYNKFNRKKSGEKKENCYGNFFVLFCVRNTGF